MKRIPNSFDRKLVIFNRYLFIAMCIVIAACGGGMAEVDPPAIDQGSYEAPIAPNHSVIADIDGHTVDVAIADAEGVQFTGVGTTTVSGNEVSATVPASGTGGTADVTVDVSGTPPQMSVHTTGAITGSGTAAKVSSAGVNSFAGTYTIQFAGADTATGTIAVTSGGLLSGTLTSTTFGTLTITGTVSGVGVMNAMVSGMSGSSPFTEQLTGDLFYSPSTSLREGSGQWTKDPTILGTWTAS